MKRIRKTGRSLVLTVKGKAEVVSMDVNAYQQVADRVDTVEGIRRGLAQAKMGLGRSVDDVIADLERNALPIVSSSLRTLKMISA